MKKINPTALFTAFLLTCLVAGCAKQDEFLNVKNVKSNVTPATLADFQAILDNTVYMNQATSLQGLVGSDNLYLTNTSYNAADQVTRNVYTWAKDIYQGNPTNDWNLPYQAIEYNNIVLDGLKELKNPDERSAAYRNVRGSALFYRACAFYRLLELFARPHSATAGTDPGIPLRLSSDITLPSTRQTVKESYERVITDLQEAAQLLPPAVTVKTRPSSVAAHAMLARVFLDMGSFAEAYTSAGLALSGSAALLNFNSLATGTANPFPSFTTGNPEMIFYAQANASSSTLAGSGGIQRADPALIQLYPPGDLRKTHFYLADGTTGLFRFKGTYTATVYLFSGLAINEVLLTHAEASARTGKTEEALADVNLLRKNRYTPAGFQAVTVTDPGTLLGIILDERRKELPFTGNTRWNDLRRLNLPGTSAITVTRMLNNTTYTLLPNENRYVLPIPDQEIQMQNLTQNPR